MKAYINIKDRYVETIDELDSNDFETIKEYRKEKQRLLSEYRMAYSGTGIVPYLSNRCTQDWKES